MSWYFSTVTACFWHYLFSRLFPAHSSFVEEAVYEVGTVRPISDTTHESIEADDGNLQLDYTDDGEAAVGVEKEEEDDKDLTTTVAAV